MTYQLKFTTTYKKSYKLMKKRGMALAHFNVKGYSKVEIDIPLIAEQEEYIFLFPGAQKWRKR